MSHGPPLKNPIIGPEKVPLRSLDGQLRHRPLMPAHRLRDRIGKRTPRQPPHRHQPWSRSGKNLCKLPQNSLKSPKMLGWGWNVGTQHEHVDKKNRHDILFSIFNTSINQLINWPNGPMARRLTTIQSAIKRFQVRPLVRSKQLFTAIISFFAPLKFGERDREIL
jgi:hypothetical protein